MNKINFVKNNKINNICVRSFSSTPNTSKIHSYGFNFINKTVKYSNFYLTRKTFRYSKKPIYFSSLRLEWLKVFNDYFKNNSDCEVFDHFIPEIKILATNDFIFELLSINTKSAHLMSIVKDTDLVKSWNHEQWIRAMQINPHVFDYMPKCIIDQHIIDTYNIMHKEYLINDNLLNIICNHDAVSLIKEHHTENGKKYYTSPVARITYPIKQNELLSNIASKLIEETWIRVILDENNDKYINNEFFSSFQNEISMLGRNSLLHLLSQNKINVIQMLNIEKIYETVNKKFTSEDWKHLFTINNNIYRYMPLTLKH